MRLRVGLDTSVFSAYYDARVTDRRAQTEAFWARRAEFDLAACDVTREELSRVIETRLRSRLLAMLNEVTLHPVTPEVDELASRYVDEGVFGPAMFDDARQVAFAVVSRQDVLLSWNFRHLVNRRRRSQVNQVNVTLGLPIIEILAPPEI